MVDYDDVHWSFLTLQPESQPANSAKNRGSPVRALGRRSATRGWLRGERQIEIIVSVEVGLVDHRAIQHLRKPPREMAMEANLACHVVLGCSPVCCSIVESIQGSPPLCA